MSAKTRFLASAQRALALPSDEPVPSPCVSVCRMNTRTGWCEGCWRSIEEITRWSSLEAEQKRLVWQVLAQRAQGGKGTLLGAAQVQPPTDPSPLA